MANIVILGAGVMGTAFSFPLADSGQKVSLVGTHLDSDWVESMRQSGVHPKLGVAIRDSVDVCMDQEDKNTIFLYEVYQDRKAFDDHLSSNHFKEFDSAVRDWVESKVVQTWDKLK